MTCSIKNHPIQILQAQLKWNENSLKVSYTSIKNCMMLYYWYLICKIIFLIKIRYLKCDNRCYSCPVSEKMATIDGGLPVIISPT